MRPSTGKDAGRSRAAPRNGGRHRPGSFARGDHSVWYAAFQYASVQREVDEARGIDGVDRGAEDMVKVGSQPLEGAAQCSFWGSDQAERPVTALNVRSRRPITCSASSFAHS